MAQVLSNLFAVEALAFDVKSGETEDKLVISISVQDDPAKTWQRSHSFNTFHELNKSIVKVVQVEFFKAEFPRKHKRTQLGMKLSQSRIDARLKKFTIWLQEIMSNFSSLPEPMQVNLITFIHPIGCDLEGKIKLVSKTQLTSMRDKDRVAAEEKAVQDALVAEISKNTNLEYLDDDIVDFLDIRRYECFKQELQPVYKYALCVAALTTLLLFKQFVIL